MSNESALDYCRCCVPDEPKYHRQVSLRELRRRLGLALINDGDIEGSKFAEGICDELIASLTSRAPYPVHDVVGKIETIIDDLKELQKAFLENRDPRNF